jgi:hypothetical protein
MRARCFEDRGPMRLMDHSQRFGSHQSSDDIGMAMLKIAHMRYQMFRARFGRDPEPHEPLFFDPEESVPVVAEADEMHVQIMAAAAATRSDYQSVMRYLGLS